MIFSKGTLVKDVIICSLVDKVVKGPQLKSSDGEKLFQLACDSSIGGQYAA